MKKVSLLGCISILVLLVTVPGHATLVSRNDPVYGPSSITLDTSTGLEWLNLTKTVLMSYNDVTSQLLPGGAFAGFSYATTDQVNQLFSDAGIPYVNSGFQTANYAPVLNLISLVGSTWGTGGALPGWTVTAALTGTFSQSEPGLVWLGQLEAYEGPPSPTSPSSPSGIATTTSTLTLPNVAAGNLGSWLIETASPVPVPSTILLLTPGLLGLMVVRRRFRK